ncbi:SET and MYND domain-containing protein 4-like [Phymastichus coffea]|uniref:SET and MYND domain-containing protein 4-like n=1 Tax=Phymastichus coffea TaxID=108790 RepID=UPI00273CDF56|nr:SET and MYND domain-containing protein 4-like [Phymastichus coffea]XP_058808126.1 SET and MYND domain-containing protein 4-like [Phymastichus coffea]
MEPVTRYGLDQERRAILDYLTADACVFEEKFKTLKVRATKCAEESRNIRSKAVRILYQKNHDVQVHEQLSKQFTESIAKAPSETEEISLAYNDRSKFLFHIRKYAESVKDIERALQITQIDSLKVELYCRKIECFVALGISVDKSTYLKTKMYLSKIDSSDENQHKLKKLMKRAKQTMDQGQKDPQTKDPRELICTSSSAARLTHSQRYGRHLVATRDVKPGEIVCAERFYAVTRNPSEQYTYCSQCLNVSLTLVPCSQCDLNMYCSESCKAKSWARYHDVECALVTPIMQICPDFDFSCRLALKFFIMALKEAGSLKNLRAELTEIEACKDPCSRGMINGKFRSNTFKSVFSLSHPFRCEKLKYLTEKCVVSLIAIAKYSKLLGQTFKFIDNRKMATSRDAVFLGGMLLKFSLIAYSNSIDYLENYTDVIVQNGQIHLKRMISASRGQALAPVTSLINHSCNPNVNKLYTDDGKVIYYCILPITKDSQIFDSYCPPFYSTWSKDDRQKYLEDFYQFKCKCEACRKDWTSAPRHNDDRTEHLELLPQHITSKDSETKSIFKKISNYIKIIVKSGDMKTKLETFSSIGDDIETLLKNVDFPSPQVIVFFYLLRLAYDKTYGCRKAVIPFGNCRKT